MKIVLKENKPFNFHRGRMMVDTNHAIERSYERQEVDIVEFPTMDSYVRKHTEMIKQAIDQILSKYKDLSSIYMLYSQGSGLGLVIEWRKDRFEDDGRNHAYVVTVLKSSPRPHYKKYDSDIRLFVEIQNRLRKTIEDNPKNKQKLLEESQERWYTRFVSDEGLTVHMYENDIVDIECDIVLVD